MKTNTYHDRLVAGLTALGWHQVPSHSHYIQFCSSQYGPNVCLFVGPSGALRKGRCASQSVSIGDATRQRTFYAKVLAAGDTVLAASQPRPTVGLKSLLAEFGTDDRTALAVEGQVDQ